MNIKKAFVAIIEVLNENLEASVADILPQIVELASAKSGGGGSKATTFHKDEDGVVVAIRCFYSGLWMDPAVVEFGKKTSSPTGLNSMCKEGVSHWTKQQRVAKLAKEQLLTDVSDGTVDASDLSEHLQAIEDERNTVVEMTAQGYETLEALLEAA